MENLKKITVEVPAELLARAQEATRDGVTQTVREGLQLLAATQAYEALRGFKGAYRFSVPLADLKADR